MVKTKILHDVLVDDELKKQDLHMHSRYPFDSYSNYEDIISLAKSFRKKTISITDHDSLGDFDRLKQLASTTGINVIQDIEISARIGSINKKCHILGYDFDPECPEFACLVRDMNKVKTQTLECFIKNIKSTYDWDFPEDINLENMVDDLAIIDVFYKVSLSIGYVNMKAFLYDNSDFDYVMDTVRENYCSVICSSCCFDAGRVVRAILCAGGVPVLAHPTKNNIKIKDINELTKLGVKGIEIFHPKYNKPKLKIFLEHCRNKGIGITAGSDFHGTKVNSVKQKFTEQEIKNAKHVFGKEIMETSSPEELKELNNKIVDYCIYFTINKKLNNSINRAKILTKSWRNDKNGYVNNNHIKNKLFVK
jgi:predicted metal-dependent phosphoesterase TrpH